MTIKTAGLLNPQQISRRLWTSAADHRIHRPWSIPSLLTTQQHGAEILGVVVPFADFERAKVAASAQQLAAGDYGDRATVEALRAAVDQAGVLAAARPLLAVCRDRYGFVVMHDGLPNAPAILSRALLELSYGLAMLDAEMKAPRTYPTYGVYFGRRQLGWLEDRYSGATGLAVPNEFKSADLAAFVRPRIVRPRSRSQD